MKNILLLTILLFLFSCSETRKQPGSYKAGFKIIQTIDKSRIYKPDTDTTDYLHYRPLDLDIWYPANSSATGSVLLFRDILGLLEKRANYYTASNAGNGLTQQIAQYFCDGVHCSDTTKLLNFKTKSLKDAAAAGTEFPLVIYLSSFNGMSYENFTLFEELAKEGFVVVSISSIGRFPGDMTMKKEDLQEQVNDAIASLNALKQISNIDFSKIGIVGYSWGALAAAILASKISNVACLVSLDGSEFHHYADAKEENTDFNDIKNSREFKNMHLSIPYLRLESSSLSETGKEDSVYNFSEKLSGEKFIFKIDSAQHEDFGCLPVVVRESANCKSNQCFNTISKLTKSFLEQNLKNVNSFSKTVLKEMNSTIRKK
ncbi:MAG: alpha/beta fold hydrolase [Ferruginibacter sp.]